VLSAYVDGELDAAEQTWVRETMARDQEVARQVMLLSKLKSAVNDAVPGFDVELPKAKPVASLRNIAAAAMLLFILSSAWVTYSMISKPTEDPQNLLQLAHSSWNSDDAATIDDKLLTLANVPSNLEIAYVPDLASAKLVVAHVAVLEFVGRPHLVVGYLGSRGCRVTLMVSAADGRDIKPVQQLTDSGGLHQASWQSQGLNYALIAKGMDAGRFQVLVSSISEGSLRNQPFSNETVMALARSRAESKPCKLA